jgi:nitrate/TMAO reductase-like tetraheme cytochrome c subunit
MSTQPLWRGHHPLIGVGAALATIGALAFLAFFLFDLFREGHGGNPYVGILFFLVLPGVFLLGLLLIPLGAWLARRRRLAGRPPAEWPRVDLNHPRQRAIVFGIVVLTLVNAVLVSLAAYRGIEFMDSVTFCGEVCHEVMQPEFVAYQNGPHARVTCVQCHIGPGAPWFVQSKLSGTRQVFAVTLNTFSRPIPSPVHNLRPARDTCEQCHWPEKFHGDAIRVRKEFAPDEANSESVTTLRLHVGGANTLEGGAQGIHWHTIESNRIEYIATDDKRQVIPYVQLTDRFGNVREYRAEGVTQEELDRGERRVMDCVDCHNRPSHTFAASAERAVDAAIAFGDISRDLPFIRREAVDALQAEYPTREAGADAIAQRLRGFYRQSYPDLYARQRDAIERAVRASQQAYLNNVFPSMNVRWGTYPNNVGHMDFPGCFRCHDDSHTAADGSVIRQECGLCHTME